MKRVPTSSDFHIEGWHFKKGERIIVSTYDTARDQFVWNQGATDDPHPVNEFWPERFILYPDNTIAGLVYGPLHSNCQRNRNIRRSRNLPSH